MTMENEKVLYKCKGCGEKFEVAQGSRRQFCSKCLVERVTRGKRKNLEHKEPE